MTAHPLTQHICDRCQAEMATVVQSKPVLPEGWLVLRITDDPHKPPSHLCPQCAREFVVFMRFHSVEERIEELLR